MTVKDGLTVLKKDTDYKIAYSGNVNAGIAKVTLTGLGNYTGTKTVEFTINPKSISKASVGSISNQTYKGSAHTPTPTVTLDSTQLVNGTDYTIAYSNNVNAGKATMLLSAATCYRYIHIVLGVTSNRRATAWWYEFPRLKQAPKCLFVCNPFFDSLTVYFCKRWG